MPTWALNTLDDFASLSVFLCAPARALCSLAEDEVKTEADVVEGMDASVRSKGKPGRPGKACVNEALILILGKRRAPFLRGSCIFMHFWGCFMRTVVPWLPAWFDKKKHSVEICDQTEC